MTLLKQFVPLNKGFLPSVIIVTAFTAFCIAPLASHAADVCETNSNPSNPHANAAQSGMGGTGVELTQSGIGGTGIDSSGIGGTGIEISDYGDTGEQNAAESSVIDGTGIVGLITGFSSICVNGIEIHYNKNTHVTMDGLPSSVSDLETGRMVIVRAKNSNGRVFAQQIAILHAVVGLVTHVDPVSKEIQVLNQIIQLQTPHATEELDEKWVRVSGLRLASGKIIASHIQLIQPLEQSTINGQITQINPGEIIIDGTRVEFSPQSWPNDLTKGMEISVSGHWNGTSIRAQTLHVAPTRQILDGVQYIVMEGYVRAINDQSLELNNQSIQISPAVQINVPGRLELNQRVQISGQLTSDNQIIVDKLKLKPSPVIQDINNISIGNGNRNVSN
ncbi:hypothetical protein SAMN05421690_100879 [Nitrosomonas sp. Nm51]|uniref:DUF5666 domain-containing protein n=1 Tax=Nitrosomonas sp. Nm51 TaxID=133720 RepID=UPI0008C91AB3|nr:DUF5666 domain-containing protein [Nitrosomonas sp. Nm51]SER10333.1 hypothetical protein SAMN05421690_100879 [Nitrosomonas sp. Nm51]